MTQAHGSHAGPDDPSRAKVAQRTCRSSGRTLSCSSESLGFSPGGLLLLAVVTMALALSIVGVAAQVPRVPETGLIAGRVVDVTSGRPVSGVAVRVGSARTKFPDQPMKTDSLGRFVFSELGAGTFFLLVAEPGYTSLGRAEVTLQPGERTTDVVLQVGRLGSIGGTVRDDAGDPVVGSSVRMFKREWLGFQPVLSPRGRTLSDDRGQFRVGNLPAGDYLVCACGRDLLPIDVSLLAQMAAVDLNPTAVAQQLNDAVPTFAPTFFPGKTRVIDAIPVELAYGEERLGLGITVLAAKPRRVSGRLIGAGANASGSQAMLLFPEYDAPEALGIAEMAPVIFTADGEFVFAGVTAGRYTLEVFPTGNSMGFSASRSIVVEDLDVTEVVVPLTGPATVGGRIVFSGNVARPETKTVEKIVVGLAPLQMTVAQLIGSASSQGAFVASTVAADGSFTAVARPGQYRVVMPTLAEPWTVESVVGPEGLRRDAQLNVPIGGAKDVVITISDAPLAQLVGSVTLSRHESPNDLRVMLFPTDRTWWTRPRDAPDRFGLTGATSTSAFAFGHVQPGDYYVVVVGQDEVMSVPGHLERLIERATTVTLRAGQTTTLTLKR